ncbi:bifunctional precorrin-2 dehydrogenase/sirohydrochlorin ferrochelatase [Paenibacillus sp. LHD-117]|uniref:precorrin-2 dehydrogenase/sirohydrochlorin ferrochelatase family protein n=1 Tax=Paenibacillus sp. LHD-117 TaxID=3071412 RepID=UPI0027E0701E|nr:bifunctional precorrin-2 dehydrogenase/sirohydrochlorin ferrochelatase [Paenibacillus sp. LHD-117]MDQ6418643.1 bifunctional precorrin-2 dehydrogenase/sirohydrochlorin ferrochelatase [Paenibacillus sp. LHD-117]
MTEPERRLESVSYYAAALQLRGRRCVVVGGGAVAERKLAGLLESGADALLLVSPEVTKGIEALAAAERVELRLRAYRESDLDGAWMVFAATDNEGLNLAIALAAEQRHLWCNVADRGEAGSFITPSVVRRGDLLLSVTASGASPALSMAIKRELERQYGPRYEAAVERLRLLREYVLAELKDEALRRDVLKLAAEETLDDSKNFQQIETGLWYRQLLDRTKGR